MLQFDFGFCEVYTALKIPASFPVWGQWKTINYIYVSTYIYIYTYVDVNVYIYILGWPIFKSRIKTGGDKKIWGKYKFPCA